MKKKITAFLLTLIMCISFSTVAFAAGEENSYIIDEIGCLNESQIDHLNEYGEYLSESIGVDVLFVYTTADENTFDEYVKQLSLGRSQNQILMIENEEVWYVYRFGTAIDMITDNDILSLRDVYVDGSTYYSSIADYMYAAATLVGGTGVVESFSEHSTIILNELTRVVDMADLLDNSEEAALLSMLDEISIRQELDVVVVTVNTLDGKTPMDYADDFYDYNGYGFGENRDGVLLLVSMEDRDWWISTTGYGITVFTDTGKEYISEKLLPDLSDGNYADAFTTYAELCDEFITQARTGEPYDTNNLPKEPFNVFTSLLISLVVGILVSLIVTGKMKGKLKTVRMQPAAEEYVRNGSMLVTESSDLFLYSHVDRRVKSKDNDSGGGSSTHTSSSGSSHGGGGGKF